MPMELAHISLNQILIMFILMAIGLICAKVKLIDEDMNKKLSSFIMLLVNPMIIFISYQRDFTAELLNGLFLSFGLAIVSYAICIPIVHFIFRKKSEDNAIEKFACIYSNCGFIGIPLIQGIFGLEGIFYLTAYLTIYNLLAWTHGMMVMSGKSDRKSFLMAFKSPAIIAVFLGFLFFILKITLPPIVAQPLTQLGNMNTPLAMIVAGVSVSQANVAKIVKNIRVYRILLIRLAILPLIIVFAFSFFKLPAILTGTIIIAAACPVGANTILFAYRYNRNHLYATELFVATTICSMISIPVILFFI